MCNGEGGVRISNVTRDIVNGRPLGRGGLEICRTLLDIFILEAFFVRTFVGGWKKSLNRNVRRTLIVNDISSATSLNHVACSEIAF